MDTAPSNSFLTFLIFRFKFLKKFCQTKLMYYHKLFVSGNLMTVTSAKIISELFDLVANIVKDIQKEKDTMEVNQFFFNFNL